MKHPTTIVAQSYQGFPRELIPLGPVVVLVPHYLSNNIQSFTADRQPVAPEKQACLK